MSMNDAMIEWIDTVHVEWRLIYFLSFKYKLLGHVCYKKSVFLIITFYILSRRKRFISSFFEFRASQFLWCIRTERRPPPLDLWLPRWHLLGFSRAGGGPACNGRNHKFIGWSRRNQSSQQCHSHQRPTKYRKSWVSSSKDGDFGVGVQRNSQLISHWTSKVNLFFTI